MKKYNLTISFNNTTQKIKMMLSAGESDVETLRAV
jgi:hypothetical protein